MEIRSSFRAEEGLLVRLAEYASVFQYNNIEEWPHYKNKEDFSRVYHLDWDQRGPLEIIYGDGRDLAVYMGEVLTAFNDARLFPTLKSFVDSFNGGWVDEIEILRKKSEIAQMIHDGLENKIWAMGKMISLFNKQIEVLVAVKQTLNQLKESTTYRWECGETQTEIQTAPYGQVLTCIDSIGKMFERYPSTYAGKDEESLRDHILVSLGASLFGSATGESFNKRGKTDILVRDVSGLNNEFIGECKFWHGEKAYHATIDQLLGYLSWRDNKTAIILFVDNQNFSAVIEKIRDSTPKHKNYVRELTEEGESWLNYEFNLPDDPQRVIKIAVMAYHLN
ncbi:MAG TPA: hypothetical protein PK461_04340 [Alcaligenes faecalis]|nr:hypothetical protein [Alcaligenes faecalis]